MTGRNAADNKQLQFTSTVVGTNHGNAVPGNMHRQFPFVKYSNSGLMSNTVTLLESNQAGTSTKILDKQYLDPGENVIFEPENGIPALVMASGNSYLRSIVEGSASGEVDVTTMFRDQYA